MIMATKEKESTRKALHSIAVPQRTNVSDKWKGIGHGVLADTLVDQIKKAGLEIKRETWYVSPKTTHTMWGALDLSTDSMKKIKDTLTLDIGQEANYSLGIRHCNGGRYAVSFAVGARVFVCSNGCFSGDFVLKHKHTQGLQLEDLIDEGIKRYLNEAETLEKFINSMRETRLTDERAAFLILEAHRTGHVNFAYLEDVYSQWNEPKHPEFQPRTVWSLYNAFTETAKLMSPPRQLKLLGGLKTLMGDPSKN